jgi:hypothetical protein
MNNSTKVQQKLTDLYGGFIVGVIIGILVFAVFCQLVISGKGGGDPQSSGWKKVVPISASIEYTANGSYTSQFANTVGTSIELTKVSINDTKTGVTCGGIKVSSTGGETSMPLNVRAGDGFTVSASCPPKESGSEYELSISVDYYTIVGGVNTSYTEHGTVKWYVG